MKAKSCRKVFSAIARAGMAFAALLSFYLASTTNAHNQPPAVHVFVALADNIRDRG